MITLTEKTYTVKDSAYTRKFIDGANWITIPWTHGNWLHFSDSKKGMVKSFYRALWEFLEEIERNDPQVHNFLKAQEFITDNK